MRGWDHDARIHLGIVNGWTPEEVRAHIDDAVAQWRLRCERGWNQDLSILGIEPDLRISSGRASAPFR